MNYHDYLHLDTLLNAQHPQSAADPSPAHDEMLFIIIHQVYELWFRQILHELDDIRQTFSGNILDDTHILHLVQRLQRISKIQQLMVDQMKIIETMSPLDFLEFRNRLGSSSGLQSFQFRLLEIRLGIPGRAGKIPALQRFTPLQQKHLEQALCEPSLACLVEQWLERTPWLQTDSFSFWESYRMAVKTVFDAELNAMSATPGLSDQEKSERLQQIHQSERHFDALFDDTLYQHLLDEGTRHLSRRATCAALMIHLYCNHPVMQMPFLLLQQLVEIDTLLARYRYAHLTMVQRMIGTRTGTGGTSGQAYLSHTLQLRPSFHDLTTLPVFLVKRDALPPLPHDLKERFGFQPA